MELSEFLVFIFINIIIMLISIWKRIGLLNVLSILFCLFMLPIALNLTVFRQNISTPDGIQTVTITANPVIPAIIFILLIITNSAILLKLKG